MPWAPSTIRVENSPDVPGGMMPTRSALQILDRPEGAVAPDQHVEGVDPQHRDRAQVLVRIQVALDAAAVREVHDVGLGEPQLPLPAVHRRHDDDAARRRLQVDVGLGERAVEALDQIVGEPGRDAGPQRELLRLRRRGPRRAGGAAAQRDQQRRSVRRTGVEPVCQILCPDDDGIGNGMTSWSRSPLPAKTKPDYTGTVRSAVRQDR